MSAPTTLLTPPSVSPSGPSSSAASSSAASSSGPALPMVPPGTNPPVDLDAPVANAPLDFGTALLQAAAGADSSSSPQPPVTAHKPDSDKRDPADRTDESDGPATLPAGFAPAVVAISTIAPATATTTGTNPAIQPAGPATGIATAAATGPATAPAGTRGVGHAEAPPATPRPTPTEPTPAQAPEPAGARSAAPSRGAEPETAVARHGSPSVAPNPFTLGATPVSSAPTAPITPVQPAQATRAPAASAPVTQPALVSALNKLHTTVDGAHEITVALHPADLGSVRVHARLHDGTLDVTVACADDAARQAVTAALPALHQELAALGSVAVALDPNAAQGAGQGGTHTDTAGQHAGRDEPAEQRRPFDDTTPRDRDTRRNRSNHDGLDRWM